MHFNFVVRGDSRTSFCLFSTHPRGPIYIYIYPFSTSLIGDLFCTLSDVLLEGKRYKVYRFKTIQLSNVKSGFSGQGGKYVISLSNKNDSCCDKDAKITKHTFCLKNHNINAILSRK